MDFRLALVTQQQLLKCSAWQMVLSWMGKVWPNCSQPTKASISHDEMATTILWHWTMFSGFETWHMSPMTPKSEIIIFSKNHNKQ
jgi:hypothetical protein